MDHETKQFIINTINESISDRAKEIESKRGFTTVEIKELQRDVILMDASFKERFKNIESKFSTIENGDDQSAKHDTQLAVLTTDVEYIKSSVQRIEILLEKDYVKKSDFEPVKKIVYGMVGIILTAVLLAVIYLVVKK